MPPIPTHFALVVGINHYPGGKPLAHARRDAEAFRDWVTDPDGGNVPIGNCRMVPANVPPVSDRINAIPRRDHVREAIVALMDMADALTGPDPDLWKATRLYVYFAGHGVAAGPTDSALLMADAGQDWLDLRVSTGDLRDYLVGKRQAFKEVVIFADCCRSRTDAPYTPLLYGKEDDKGDVHYAVFHGTEFGKRSFEPIEAPNDARGYFTEALLLGLWGDATDADVPITTRALRDHLQLRVPQLTSHLDSARQFPFPEVPYEALTLVPKSAGPGRRQLTLHFTQDYGQVQLMDGYFNVIRGPFTATKDALWRMLLRKAIYRIVDVAGQPLPGVPNEGMFIYSGEPNHVKEI